MITVTTEGSFPPGIIKTREIFSLDGVSQLSNRHTVKKVTSYGLCEKSQMSMTVIQRKTVKQLNSLHFSQKSFIKKHNPSAGINYQPVNISQPPPS